MGTTTHGGQRTTLRSQSSPSTLWVLRIKLGSLHLAANVLPVEPWGCPGELLFSMVSVSIWIWREDSMTDMSPGDADAAHLVTEALQT